MRSTNRKIVGISAAVAALTGPAIVAPAAADASDSSNHVAADAAVGRQALVIGVGDEFMSFTVGEGSGGVVADHSSHASHASHSSHSSHYSSR